MSIERASFPQAQPGGTTDDWFLPWGATGVGADQATATAAHVVAWPFYFGTPVSLKTLRTRLVTAQTGAEAMAGIYTNANARPAALVRDLGTKSLATGSGSYIDWSITTLNLSGWFWALMWVKDVATQASFRRPTANAQPLGLPVISTALLQTNNGGYLYLESAYPGSMPATAPAVAVTTSLNVPLVMLQVG